MCISHFSIWMNDFLVVCSSSFVQGKIINNYVIFFMLNILAGSENHKIIVICHHRVVHIGDFDLFLLSSLTANSSLPVPDVTILIKQFLRVCRSLYNRWSCFLLPSTYPFCERAVNDILEMLFTPTIEYQPFFFASLLDWWVDNSWL